MAFLDFFTGVDSEETQKTLDQTDAQLKALEADYQRRHADTLSQEELDKRNAEFNAHMASGHVESVEAEVEGAFTDELDARASGLRNFAGGALSLPFQLIPWQAWAIGAVALFIWLGGPALLKGKLGKLA